MTTAMKVIDAHLHLDDKLDGTPETAARELNQQLEQANIARAVVLHLETQGWSLEHVASSLRPFPRLRAFANVHPFHPEASARLKHAKDELGYIGLKLHPRLQNFSITDPRVQQLCATAGLLQLPVLVDAFPDGTHLMMGFHANQYSDLARACPDTRFIWAHMGGHHVLDFMMLAKRLPNVFFDISYSLLYYQKSSIPQNMVYAMQSMRYQRIFYGSDYPDRTAPTTLAQSLEFLQSQGVQGENLERILFRNAAEFFAWSDL